jgi:hypothetical protein
MEGVARMPESSSASMGMMLATSTRNSGEKKKEGFCQTLRFQETLIGSYYS